MATISSLALCFIFVRSISCEVFYTAPVHHWPVTSPLCHIGHPPFKPQERPFCAEPVHHLACHTLLSSPHAVRKDQPGGRSHMIPSGCHKNCASSFGNCCRWQWHGSAENIFQGISSVKETSSFSSWLKYIKSSRSSSASLGPLGNAQPMIRGCYISLVSANVYRPP